MNRILWNTAISGIWNLESGIWDLESGIHPQPDKSPFERTPISMKGSSSMAAVPSAESMEARAEDFRSAYERVRSEIAKVIVGHDEIVHGVLTCLFIGGHALLE